ncbi:hypothetical protein [Mucilaginibacter sp. UYCu711]|uniref:hypothetical protein n=1 Tax=Mucilaginibacter sp. UYCu711 TaxID=3156339 RepID=UPI003D232AA6
MLKDVVHIILSANNYHETDGTLFCHGVPVDDETSTAIQFLEVKDIIENTDYENRVGATIKLELSIARLNGIGYYQNADSLILKNKYNYPATLFYVAGVDRFSDEPDVKFYSKYKIIIDFINAIKTISRHNYTDVDMDYALIFRDDKALLLPFTYGSNQVEHISAGGLKGLQAIIDVFSDSGTEKQLLFINEMIDYLSPAAEVVRFTTLLRNVSDFVDKCNNAYQYYLRDFSYNKLKIELDSKALEFTQKIQSVINDSQNKLVTIPTAFVLVFATFDFKDPDSIKNIVSIISLFIFAVLIQIFLNNQFSSLNFTEANISAYKETFSQSNIEKFKEKFALVDNELSKQKNRLILVIGILWLIPIVLLILWLTLPSPPITPLHK